ncbi:hypothetical protein NC651_021067 [Populus alba x Populus x berolinensis]|nr:hypothetical protein NC651_021067 [Populus alba x Populus x berolinensis]
MSLLEKLDISQNFLNGPSMSRMASLSFLHLSSNHLSGALPTNWQALQGLTVIDLSCNNLSGRIPSSMWLSSSLIWLELRNNNLYGELSSTLQNCTGLFALDLGGNKFFGAIPNLFAKNPIFKSQYAGPIPRCLRDLTVLKLPGLLFKFLLSTLHVPSSSHAELNVEGRLVEYTSIIYLVNSIDLSCNNLSGVIPEEITNLSTLVTLNLSWNQLTGMIPENIGSLKQIEDPDLSSNHHSGLIPPSMTSLTFLKNLNLSFNNLSGQFHPPTSSIPSMIHQFTRVTLIFVDLHCQSCVTSPTMGKLD